MAAKDFAEKAVKLEDNETLYEYASSIPIEAFPAKSPYSRSETIFSGSILTKEEGVFILYMFSQVNVIKI